jgi:hypothetical protein
MQWLPLARSFKALCIEHRLGIDMTVTADAARVLRMVDTENYKVTPALPVQLLASGVISDLAVLTALMPAPPMDLSAAKSYGMDEMTAN